MKQKILILSMLLCVSASTLAQEGNTAYSFLDVPVSSHSAALGGNNISIIEDDITLMFTNPTALANVADNTINFSYMSYMAGTNKFSAAYAKAVGERGTLGFGASYLNYGSMTKTNESHEELGTFSAKDIDIQMSYCYNLSERWTGAVTAKALFSNYGDYSSTGLGVDLGINYYDEDYGWSLSLAAQNLGGQVKTFEDSYEKMPFHLVFGISKEMYSAPLRFSLTLDDLTHWDKDYYYNVTGEEESFGSRLVKHVALGVDIFPSSATWIAAGYNFRRGKEMKVNDSSHWAGFSIGGGLCIKRFKLGVTYGKYHVGASSIIANVSLEL